MSRKFVCPVCEFGKVNIRYVCDNVNHKEYLVCKCSRCEYRWEEKTSEASEPEKQRPTNAASHI